MTNLTTLITSGMKWSSATQAVRQGAQLLTMLLLARLLNPSDFGLLGMSLAITAFIGIFKDLGTSLAVIQKQELTDSFLSSTFWANVAFNILIMLVIYLGAPLGGLFYNEDRIVPILRVLSVSFPIASLGTLQQSMLVRSMKFDVLARADLAAILCGSVAGVGLAVMGAGAWSLVCQTIISGLVLTAFLWSSSSWRPRFTFHPVDVLPIASYVTNFLGYSVVNYFARNADYLIVGRLLGAVVLGYYSIAYNVLLFPLRNISSITNRVMFPVYARMQNDNRKFSLAYIKVAFATSLISFPMMFGICAVATPFVASILGEPWRPVIPLILILAPVGLVQSISSANSLIYTSKGRTDWLFKWTLVTGAVSVLSFLVGVRWGITGVAISYAFANALFLYPDFFVPFRLIDLKFGQLLDTLKLPFINSLIMFLAMLLFMEIIPSSMSDLLVLLLAVILGLFVFGLLSWLTVREQIHEIWSLIRH